jgi:hypothetical protein
VFANSSTVLGGVNDDSVETCNEEDVRRADPAAAVVITKDVVVVGIADATARNNVKEIFILFCIIVGWKGWGVLLYFLARVFYTAEDDNPICSIINNTPKKEK